MATVTRGIPEEDDAAEEMVYEMVMEISAETKDLLSRLAGEVGCSEFDVIGRAVALYQVAVDAHREGKKIGIFSDDDELEREIVGL